MGNAEEVAEKWRDREFAKKFVENLGLDDRIRVFTRVDSETGRVSETYALFRPPAERAPIDMSGDWAAVREAIESGMLEPDGEGSYKKRDTVRNPAPD
jgi:hypothetical protein